MTGDVFISYAREDAVVARRVREQLNKCDVSTWFDEENILGGQEWRSVIVDAIDTCKCFAVLLSEHSINKQGHVQKELRQALDVLAELPPGCIFIIPCRLANVRTPHRALRALHQIDLFPSFDEGFIKLRAAIEFALQGRAGHSCGWSENDLARALEKLRVVDTALVGRSEELGWLERCYHDSNVQIVALTAFGGVGKTALVRAWLQQERAKPGAARLIACSFYSQGQNLQVATSDQFILETLEMLDDCASLTGSAWSRARRLAKLLNEEATVLVLDGLEPLQHAPVRSAKAGRLRDNGIEALLTCLAEDARNVFCIITSRLSIKHRYSNDNRWVERPLLRLSAEAAVSFMRRKGLKGHESEFARAAEYLGYHSLAIVLACEYLKLYKKGLVRHASEIPLQDISTRAGRHAKSVLAAYEAALSASQGALPLELLSVLSLFDRPVTWECLSQLACGEPLAGFRAVGGVTPDELESALDGLQGWGLLSKTDELRMHRPSPVDTVDTHPLIREYFGSRLRRENRLGWNNAHSKVATYFAGKAPQKPVTPADVDFVLLAVSHACKSGDFGRALHEQLEPRVMQGQERYAIARLGLLEPVLAAISHFFDGQDWSAPIASEAEPENGLTDEDRISLLCTAGLLLAATRGYAYQAVGDTYERAQDLAAGSPNLRKATIEYGLWRFHVATGEWVKSVRTAGAMLELADHSSIPALRLGALRALATSHVWMGDFEAGLRRAEQVIQAQVTDGEVHAIALELGDDPVLLSKAMAAVAEWHLGRPGKGTIHYQECLSCARTHRNPYVSALGVFLAGILSDYMDDCERIGACGEELIELSHKHGMLWWLGAGLMRRGYALASRGEDGLSDFTEGYGLWKEGATGGVPYWNSLEAKIRISRGEHERANELVLQGIDAANITHERGWLPELYRLRANVRQELGIDDRDIVRDLDAAMRTAEELKSVPLQLRAILERGLWMEHHGRYSDARAYLSARIRKLPLGYSELSEALAIKQAVARLGEI